jgi:hypothetical protein
MRKLVVHGGASVLSVLVATGMPTAFYYVLVVGSVLASGDLGGPLNFLLVPLASGLLGLAVTVLAYLPCGLLLSRWARRHNKPVWLPFAAFGALLAITSLGMVVALMAGPNEWRGLLFASIALAGLTIGMTIQWGAILVLSAVFAGDEDGRPAAG